ncbi:hypothetical protein EYZ11_005094 [Aspergillus tanneri]|uniref:Uncharacterized protein n=1 Tax=Aspergillus tanneri TaxID=1220188 RepID=A0A4S3JJA1_9EURO|nr:hypothetical protein EYZ11_005094 [Aspergillus tanneri]
MNFFLLLFLVFFAPLLLFLGLDAYGRDYLRTMANSGSAMSEQIELDNMLVESDRNE